MVVWCELVKRDGGELPEAHRECPVVPSIQEEGESLSSYRHDS
jgi:hypothetical protein